MITQIQGKLVEKNPTDVVIDCQGVGYLVNISLHTYSKISENEVLKLYTVFLVREDAHTLYGFIDKKERELFKLLISVNGIGANIARTMLSSLTPEQTINAIAHEDVVTIQTIKGIGTKTAQRTILDLKDKVIKLYDIEKVSDTLNNTTSEEALSALEVLGFNRKASEKIIEQIVKNSPSITVEELLKQALKNL